MFCALARNNVHAALLEYVPTILGNHEYMGAYMSSHEHEKYITATTLVLLAGFKSKLYQQCF